MIVIKLHDKRYYKGFNMAFFHTDVITDEIIDFVKKHKNAFRLESKKYNAYTREDLLNLIREVQNDNQRIHKDSHS